MEYELIVIGGGPAGLAAACQAWEEGLTRILILERDRELGGILNQCIHNGFGLHYFKEELTGPEYAGRFVQMLTSTGVEVQLDTMVLDVSGGEDFRTVQAVSAAKGYQCFRTKTVILAMGCRERTRGAIGLPGTRPAGIFTAGAAQRYLNMEGYMVGRRVVILGSGDIGLIMARRMTLEGAEVLACVEVMPYSGGLNRNIVQCLHDYNIPLYLSHTVTDIRGRERLEQITVSQVDEKRVPIPGTEMIFDCDTLLLSVGLIPENELSRQAGIEMDPRTSGAIVNESMETSLPGVFACGNVVHVHDLVDFVTAESQRAGGAAARFVKNGNGSSAQGFFYLQNGGGVTYTVPQRIHRDGAGKGAEVFFRVNRILGESRILVRDGEGALLAQYRREHLAPGEMEHILLPYALLNRAKGDTVTVSVEEGNAND